MLTPHLGMALVTIALLAGGCEGSSTEVGMLADTGGGVDEFQQAEGGATSSTTGELGLAAAAGIGSSSNGAAGNSPGGVNNGSGDAGNLTPAGGGGTPSAPDGGDALVEEGRSGAPAGGAGMSTDAGASLVASAVPDFESGFCASDHASYVNGNRCYTCGTCNYDENGVASCFLSEEPCPGCFSPAQNVALSEEGAEGCWCEERLAIDLCISHTREDESTKYFALSCQAERWLSTEDGPCVPKPAGATACEHLAQHRLESLEVFQCNVGAEAPEPCRQTIQFNSDGSYYWDNEQSTKGGSYECDGQILFTLSGEERIPMGNYNPSTLILTWDGAEYR